MNEQPKLKTLANCSPRDFLVQTNKIRKKVSEWLTLTQILEIRKRAPIFTEDMSDAEKKDAARKKATENIMAMLDSAMGEHPNETAELLGMLCFIEPEDLDNHTMLEFLTPATELISNPEVISFFMSLAKLDQMATSTAAKA